uniref:Calreticulin n=1 Tax=Timema tahoe TaxID=61484 RepID=A0A7R9IT30_9NEOP|nr:unnamed protein product [Timema tahoe]
MLYSTICVFIALGYVHADVYLDEKFLDDSWESNWVASEHPGKELGKFVLTHGKFFNDPENDKGIQTSQDARFYALSRKFKPFSNKDKPLLNMNKDIHCKDDVYTHLYTLIVKPDNTYEVLIDNSKVESGELEVDWDFLPPKKIQDPEAKKPEDWDDRSTIDDPNDSKPEYWDKPEHVADPDATKPEDWDDEMDGEWEPPMIDNPDFKREWKSKQIDNPNYKCPWVYPEIDNPEYAPDPEIYRKDEVCAIGFDLWQVKAGTIFDNVLIADDPEHAKEFGEEAKSSPKDDNDEDEDEDEDDEAIEAGEAPETGEEDGDEHNDHDEL